MAVTKYLDKTGLSHFWSKIKAWANSLFALDSTVVHKTGDTMTGDLAISSTSPNLFLKNTSVERGTSPDSYIAATEILGRDKNNNSTWALYHTYDTDKTHCINLLCYNGLTTNNSYAGITVGYDSNGNPYTSALTPAKGDNSSKIATTAFVKTKCNDYLLLTGGTMTGTLSERASNVNISVEPASQKEDYRFYITRSDADTVNNGNLMRLGVAQAASTKDYRILLGVSNPRGSNIPTQESIARGDDDSDAITGNCWGSIGVYYDYSKNRAYPLVSGCSAYPNNDSDSSHLATTAWVRNATGDFACNAATATAFASSKAVTLTGAVTGTASSTGDWSVSTLWRSCVVRRTASGSTNPWYKVAAKKLTGSSYSYNITFYIENTNSNRSFGILRVSVPTDSNKNISVSNIKFTWLANEGFSVEDFVLVCPTGAEPTVELWTKLATGWLSRLFVVISEGNVYGTSTLWTLFNTASDGQEASITTEGTQIASEAPDLVGNIATATEFSANKSVTLTGDVAGTASSKAGWSVATTLANSGVTAGSYGPSANATPAYGATFNVPYITVDAKGRVTAASTKTVKIPASDNTDSKVRQVAGTGNSNRPILVRYNAADASETDNYVVYNDGVTINTSTCKLTASGGFVGDVTGNCSGTSSNVTGTVAITNGGTGATTRLNAVKNLTNENVGTDATFFLTITNSWGKAGFTSVANAKTVLGLGSAAYTASTAYATASHTHSYLPLSGGTLTGSVNHVGLTYKSTTIDRADITTESATEIWTQFFKDKNSLELGGYGIQRGYKGGYNRLKFRLRNTSHKWADLIFQLNDDNEFYLWLTGTTGTSNSGFHGDVTGIVKRTMDLATISTIPSSSVFKTIWECYSQDNERVADSYVTRNTSSDGWTAVVLRSRCSNGTSDNHAYLHLWCNKDGSSKYVTFPSPSTESNADTGATTAWVRTYCSTTYAPYFRSTILDVTSASVSSDQWYVRGWADKNNINIMEQSIEFSSSSDIRHFSWRIYDKSKIQHWLLFLQINNDGTSPLLNVGGTVKPQSNNTMSLGNASYKWTAVYATNGTIQTSDARLKNSIENISDTVLDAWENINWVQYQLKDAIEKKGNSARIHSGLIAQDLNKIFTNKNIDISRYGVFCYDEWDAIPDTLDENGNIAVKGIDAGNAFSIRYDEALAIEAAYQRRKNKILEKRISDLEEQLASVLEILNNLKGA